MSSEAISPAPVAAKRANPTLLVLRIAVTLAAFGYVLFRQPPQQLLASVAQISPLAIVQGIGFTFFALVIAAFRWRALLIAYGASNLPSYGHLFRAFLVGHFYNTCLPGGIGGDLVRGVVTRSAFGEAGTARALATVFVDRLFGLAGLFGLVASVLLVQTLPGIDRSSTVLFAVLGLLGAFGVIVGVAVGRRLSSYFPAPIARLGASLPELVTIKPFFFAFACAIGTQSLMAMLGHTIITSLDASITWSESFVVVPVASAAAFFPISVGGAGVRDAALVTLYERVGASGAAAPATAIGVLFCHVVVGLTGGLVHLLRPLTDSKPR